MVLCESPRVSVLRHAGGVRSYLGCSVVSAPWSRCWKPGGGHSNENMVGPKTMMLAAQDRSVLAQPPHMHSMANANAQAAYGNADYSVDRVVRICDIGAALTN